MKNLNKYITFLCFLSYGLLLLGQEGYGDESNCDLDHPYPVGKDGIYNLRFQGTSGVSDYLQQTIGKKEFNAFWVSYRPNYNGIMEFELTTKDKYRVDFYLYRKTKDSTNSNLEFISKGSTAGSGSTGMNLIMVSLENFQEPIEVKPSEQYLILFNCFDMKKSRFDLNIAVNTDFGGLIKYNKIVDLTSSKDKPVLNIKMRDAETGGLVETMVQIIGLKLDQNIYMGTDFMIHPNGNQVMELECTAMGYFFQTKFIDPKSTEGSEVVVMMERLKIGKKLHLDNIKFSRGTDEFLQVSEKTLIKLEKFMLENKNVRIEVQGHVNGPKMDNTKDLIDLSEKRARAVMDYLVKKGINKERIAYRGLGNSEMIHKNPIFEEQAEENRRVEIMIIE